MLRKDLTTLKIYKPAAVRDGEGGEYNEYGEPSGAFEGNIQPISEQNAAEAYGISLTRAFAVYTADKNTELAELYRIGRAAPEYEIKTVEAWPGYRKIICEGTAGE